MDYYKAYKHWLDNCDSKEIKQELEKLADNEEEIKDRFYKNLEFGTGGLRGKIGAGTNRMNIYTVRKASQGLATYIKKLKADSNAACSVVIAYDSRHKSKDFALESALVLAENNIKAYLFQEITPTPLLSYAVRKLRATAGIVITASHNPAAYNGYKVYWSDGGQITDYHARQITESINLAEDELKVKFREATEAEEKGLLVWLDDEVFTSYLQRNTELVLNKESLKSQPRIVYSPLHGTGYRAVTSLLQKIGYNNVFTVEEQVVPDGDFPTVQSPNPEEHQAFEMALAKAGSIDADIALATDPDADRLGVAVKDHSGKYIILTGNQLGALMIDYLLKMRSEKKNLPSNGVIIKTIVTSDLGIKIAEKYGVSYVNVLTGFKYIGEKIKEFQETKEAVFVFGYEESYGYLIGDYVRDKDGIQACLLAVEMAAYYKQKGISIYERLKQIYEEYGYYKEDLVSFSLEGIEGQKRIERIMDFFRTEMRSNFKEERIILIKDYLKGESLNHITKERKKTNLPKSNVIHYTLSDNSWFCVRPSGTEPKLKIYFSVSGGSDREAQEKLDSLKEVIIRTIEEIK